MLQNALSEGLLPFNEPVSEGARELGRAPQQSHQKPGQNRGGDSVRIWGQQHLRWKVAKMAGTASLRFALLLYGPPPQKGVSWIHSLLIYTSQGLSKWHRISNSSFQHWTAGRFGWVFSPTMIPRWLMLPCSFKTLKNPDLNYLTSIHSPFPPLSFLFCFLSLDVFISRSVIPVT